MRIDKKMNLVIPIYGEAQPRLDEHQKPIFKDGRPETIQPVTAYVHSTPISREVFEKYFLVIAQTFSAIYNQGFGEVAGPSIAMLLLKRAAEISNQWEDDPARGITGVRLGLVEEIRRNTVVAIAGPTGWQQVPIAVAAQSGALDPDDMWEVENAIVFFIVAYAMHRRAERKAILTSAVDLWGAQISSLSATEFVNSIQTSTATVNSGEKPPVLATASPSAPGANAVVDGKPASVAF